MANADRAALAGPDCRDPLCRPAAASDGAREVESAASPQESLEKLQDALAALRAENASEAAELAVAALRLDEASAPAWRVLGQCREMANDPANALRCFETAFRLDPDNVELRTDIGRLAYRLGFLEEAEQVLSAYVAERPDAAEAVNTLALVLRDLFRPEEAVALLTRTLERIPETPLLWNTVGSVLAEGGDMRGALVFFDEALRLQPDFVKARYNRSMALYSEGHARLAVHECDAALEHARVAPEAAIMRLARATMLLADGRLEAGWEEYEARLSPAFPEFTHFHCEAPRWRPEDDLDSKRLLVFGEQGLGDEIMFANVLEDVRAALGPKGRLTLACEPRLQPLFQRAFPWAEARPHATFTLEAQTVRVAPGAEAAEFDLHAPIGSLMRRFRGALEAFPRTAGYLRADPAAAAAWRARLADLGPGLKVGLLWKSGVKASSRARYYAPFDAWEASLRTPGCRFVNLQYGEVEAELTEAEARFGVRIWRPPELDLKNDLDELAGLMEALDLVVGPANAATNLAGALGRETWIVAPPGAWTRLGTPAYPWYPSARVFAADRFGDWRPAMAEVAAELRAKAAGASAT